MRKLITYTIFIVATVLVVILFVTSKDFAQLGLAALLYPFIAFLALSLFPRRVREYEADAHIQIPLPSISNEIPQVAATSTPNSPLVADVDKRAFIKLIGVAGVSVFLFSLLSKRAQVPFFGKMAEGSDTVAVKDSKGKTIDPAQAQPFDGYQISEIDDGIVSYYGFINQVGAWFIMREDTESNSFRYSKGTGDFPKGWMSREKLKYDYFYNV